MNAVRQQILDAAISYADRGWRVLPISSEKKLPLVGKSWQTKATTNGDMIAAWWESWPTANVGVCMGPASGLVDFECDSDEGEAELGKLFGISGVVEWPITPTFVSGSGRGRHRLFVYRYDLPEQANRNWKGIDFKLGSGDKGSQSVFPPSVHKSGGLYTWLPGLSPNECELADLPDSVVAALCNLLEGDDPEKSGKAKRPTEHWEKILAGSVDGERTDSMVSSAGKLMRTVRDLESNEDVSTAWLFYQALNHRNRPPLDEKKLRAIFLSIRDSERRRRAGEEFASTHSPTRKQIDPTVQRAIDADDCGLRLRIIESDPPSYELFGEQFAESDGGRLVLTPEQLINGNAIRLAALKQAHMALPNSFVKAWGRKGGIYERLVATAERVESPADTKRPAIIAQRILDLLGGALPATDGKMNPYGYATKLDNGSVIFSISTLMDDMRFSADKILRPEVARVLNSAGVNETRPRSHSSRKRLRLADEKAISRLEKIADGEPPGQAWTVVPT